MKADGLYYGNCVFLSLILLYKTFPRNTTREMLDKNKTLDWNACVGWRDLTPMQTWKPATEMKKQAYNAFTLCDLAIPFLRLFQGNSLKEKSSVYEDA